MARKDKKALEQPGKNKKPKKPPEQVFAEKVRYHKEMDSRWAILKEARVEYFRGKDFSDLIRRHPELGYGIINKEEAQTLQQPLEQVLAEALLMAHLIVRCDRVVKTVRPGRKKLSKWPARLEIHHTQLFTTEEGFYTWTFERQSPMWQKILTALFPIFIVACCLFPVFPHWAKLTVLYFLLSLISAIFLLLLVRLLVFLVIWVFTGRRVWFFPRILEEEGTVGELFRFWPDKDEDPPSKLLSRAAVALLLAFTFWLMVKYAPDENTRAKYRKKVTNIIDDFVAWTPQMIAGNTTAPANATGTNSTGPGNATAANDNGTRSGRASERKGPRGNKKKAGAGEAESWTIQEDLAANEFSEESARGGDGQVPSSNGQDANSNGQESSGNGQEASSAGQAHGVEL